MPGCDCKAQQTMKGNWKVPFFAATATMSRRGGPNLLSAKTNSKRKRLSTQHVLTQYTTGVIREDERHRLWILECPLSRFSRAWVEIPSSLSCPRQSTQWHCQRETSKTILETNKVTESGLVVKGEVISCQTPCHHCQNESWMPSSSPLQLWRYQPLTPARCHRCTPWNLKLPAV